ncbi:hypothetical protein, partial [Parachlamydia sp.]
KKESASLKCFLRQKLNGSALMEDFRFSSEKMPSTNEQNNPLEISLFYGYVSRHMLRKLLFYEQDPTSLNEPLKY